VFPMIAGPSILRCFEPSSFKSFLLNPKSGAVVGGFHRKTSAAIKPRAAATTVAVAYSDILLIFLVDHLELLRSSTKVLEGSSKAK
jgi:hypothetical protein